MRVFGPGKVLVFGDHAAAPTLGASTAAIYNHGSEMFVMNSNGTATKISKNYDPDEAATWGLIVPDSDPLPSACGLMVPVSWL